MTASVPIGKMVKTLPLLQIGMKVLNILIMNLMGLIQAMAAVLKVIKVNSLNPFSAEVNIVKVAVVHNHAKA